MRTMYARTVAAIVALGSAGATLAQSTLYLGSTLSGTYTHTGSIQFASGTTVLSGPVTVIATGGSIIMPANAVIVSARINGASGAAGADCFDGIAGTDGTNGYNLTLRTLNGLGAGLPSVHLNGAEIDLSGANGGSGGRGGAGYMCNYGACEGPGAGMPGGDGGKAGNLTIQSAGSISVYCRILLVGGTGGNGGDAGEVSTASGCSAPFDGAPGGEGGTGGDGGILTLTQTTSSGSIYLSTSASYNYILTGGPGAVGGKGGNGDIPGLAGNGGAGGWGGWVVITGNSLGGTVYTDCSGASGASGGQGGGNGITGCYTGCPELEGDPCPPASNPSAASGGGFAGQPGNGGVGGDLRVTVPSVSATFHHTSYGGDGALAYARGDAIHGKSPSLCDNDPKNNDPCGGAVFTGSLLGRDGGLGGDAGDVIFSGTNITLSNSTFVCPGGVGGKGGTGGTLYRQDSDLVPQPDGCLCPDPGGQGGAGARGGDGGAVSLTASGVLSLSSVTYCLAGGNGGQGGTGGNDACCGAGGAHGGVGTFSTMAGTLLGSAASSCSNGIDGQPGVRGPNCLYSPSFCSGCLSP